MPIKVTPPQTAAQSAAQQLTEEANNFTNLVRSALANGVAATTGRAAVSAADLKAQFAPADLAKLEAIAAAGA